MRNNPRPQWRRLAAGKYVAETPFGDIRLSRGLYIRRWHCVLPRGVEPVHSFGTLAEAKRALPSLVETVGKRVREQRAQRAIEICRSCRIADSPVAPNGYWREWAEHKVGCTAADVRRANEPRLSDLLDEFFAEQFEGSADDLRREFCEWYFNVFC